MRKDLVKLMGFSHRKQMVLFYRQSFVPKTEKQEQQQQQQQQKDEPEKTTQTEKKSPNFSIPNCS